MKFFVRRIRRLIAWLYWKVGAARIDRTASYMVAYAIPKKMDVNVVVCDLTKSLYDEDRKIPWYIPSSTREIGFGERKIVSILNGNPEIIQTDILKDDWS